ncbi:cytochrome d ubiquinol oxidase subunit II (plasmid) [Azospirillum humicireducens]|uniref:Cytochrome d ubiquinol oxidase subunit II n=1 Tax=Azospirillum humicireducens TaxID=1226968 RepID=A0A2R4VV81_9PROT|nr:cytochrome d ubiquinol oxidase subunit II [Azospirillum humicireducens]AWB08339.1 cytochrome d ubiquinol oxidase subunit II [Azospirillum humicireducens]
METLIDYEHLRLIWWLFLGVLLIGFAVMDGFDLGVAALLPLVARTDLERRVAINSIGPVWDGNQVWLILGAGAIFAAWPAIYAAAFSGFYIALFLVLVTLILRPVGFEFRNKFADTRWRGFWDAALVAGGVVPSLVFGVAFGNLLQGVPFRIDDDLRVFYEGGGLLELLNPFGLLAGLLSLAMLTTHGAVYLALKTDGAVRQRAAAYVRAGAPVTILLFLLAGLWVALGLPGYALVGTVVTDGPSNPLFKQVELRPGGWLANYASHPWMVAAPVLGVLGPAGAFIATLKDRPGIAFIASATGIAGIVATAGVSMFPMLMPSSLVPSASLTVWDASSSHRTLLVMLVATLIFLPLILAYTGLIFRVLRGRVGPADIQRNPSSLY